MILAARARVEAHEGRDLLPVPEPHLLRRRHATASRPPRARSSASTRPGCRSRRRRCSPGCRRRRAATTRAATPRQRDARQRYVLDRMLAAGFITAEQYADGARRADRARDAGSRPPTTPRPGTSSTSGRCSRQEYGSAFATLGLQVHTAVDLRLQGVAEEVLHEGLRTIERQLGRRRTVRHLPADDIDEFLERQRASRPREGPQQAVVTGVHGGRDPDPHAVGVRDRVARPGRARRAGPRSAPATSSPSIRSSAATTA